MINLSAQERTDITALLLITERGQRRPRVEISFFLRMEMTPFGDEEGGGGCERRWKWERMTLEEGRERHRAEMKGIHRDCAVYLLIARGDCGSKVANDLIDVKSLRCQTARRYIREMRHWTPHVLRCIKGPKLLYSQPGSQIK